MWLDTRIPKKRQVEGLAYGAYEVISLDKSGHWVRPEGTYFWGFATHAPDHEILDSDEKIVEAIKSELEQMMMVWRETIRRNNL